MNEEQIIWRLCGYLSLANNLVNILPITVALHEVWCFFDSAPSARLKIVTDLRDSVDVVHVALPEVLSGLVHVLETSQPQNEQNEEHKLRKSSIEVLHRVPHTTALKDHVPRLAACLQSVALHDNQENAIVAMKVVLDLMRAFKPELEEAAIPMLEVFVKVRKKK